MSSPNYERITLWTWTNASPPSSSAPSTPRCVFDLAKLESEASQIEAKTQAPDFWSDNIAAQAAMRRLSYVNDTVSTWRGLQKRVEEAQELYALATEDNDPDMIAGVEAEADAV